MPKKSAVAKKTIPAGFYKQLIQGVMGTWKGMAVRSCGETARKIAHLSSMEDDGPENPVEVGSDEWLTEATKLLYANTRETFRLLTTTTPPLTSPDAIPEIFTFLGLTKEDPSDS